MPMDSSELKAFANGPKPTDGDMHDGDPEAEESQAENAEPRDFTNLVAKLTEFAEDLEASADELDPEMLMDLEAALESDDATIIYEGFENLDRNLRKELQSVFPLAQDEAMEIAGELEGAGVIEDSERIAGYLLRLSEMMQNSGADDNPDDTDDDADDDNPGDGEGGNPY